MRRAPDDLGDWATIDAIVSDLPEPEVQTDQQTSSTNQADPFDPPSDDDRRSRFIARALVPALDVTVVVTAALAISIFGSSPGWIDLLFATMIALPLLIGGEAAASRLTLSVLDEAPRILGCVGISLLLVAPFGVAAKAEGALFVKPS